MRVDFVRHGIAIIAEPDIDDVERTLSDRGTERTREIAQVLHRRHVAWQTILSSPLRRAQETAAIFLDKGLSETVEVLPDLSPGGDFNALATWQAAHLELSKLALVGHQPDLSNWIEIALWGNVTGSIQLKKAGIARVEFPEGLIRPSKGILIELLTPKSLLFG